MAKKCAVLKNEYLQADILLDWDYRRSRYDWGGTVGQVTMKGHTFLSGERNTSGGVGLGGVGRGAADHSGVRADQAGHGEVRAWRCAWYV